MSTNETDDSKPQFSSNDAEKIIAKLENDVAEAKQESKESYEKAKIEIEKKLQEQKDEITKEVRQELLAEIKLKKQKLDEETKKQDLLSRKKIISKIKQMYPEAKHEILESMDFEGLKQYYLSVVKVNTQEKLKKFKVSCPKKDCYEYLGTTTNKDEAVHLQKTHNKLVHGSSRNEKIAKLILFSVFMSLAFFATSAFLQSRKKKEESD